MDAPPKDERSQFHIMTKLGKVAILMPAELGSGDSVGDGFSLSSPRELHQFLGNLLAAGHVAFPDDFPHPGAFQGKVAYGRFPDPDGLKN